MGNRKRKSEASAKCPKKAKVTHVHQEVCAVLESLGPIDISSFKQHHDMTNCKHPKEYAECFSKYLSHENTHINLKEDSCICSGCYNDAKRVFLTNKYLIEAVKLYSNVFYRKMKGLGKHTNIHIDDGVHLTDESIEKFLSNIKGCVATLLHDEK